jgi:CBS domain-containing protein
MSTVRKMLDEKGEKNKIYSVPQDAKVLDALKVMAKADTGCVLVTEGDKFVGIFSERDYARLGELKGHCAKDTLVNSVMTKKLVSVKPETSVQQCMELMTKYHIRHLPVVAEEKVVGMISIGDVVRAKIEDAESTINELQNYILGTGYGR